MSSCEFYEISKNTSFTEHIWTTASAYGYETLLIPIRSQIPKGLFQIARSTRNQPCRDQLEIRPVVVRRKNINSKYF